MVCINYSSLFTSQILKKKVYPNIMAAKECVLKNGLNNLNVNIRILE